MEEPVLRPLSRDDVEAVLAAFTSSDDMARQGDVSDLAGAQAYVADLLDAERHQRVTAITEAGRLVGLVVVSVDPDNRNGWVSYWMHAAHRGRGWTARAVAAVADRQLGAGGLERLELGHRANNPASGAVAAAAGFVQEGVERGKFLVDGRRIDVLTYGRLATDPWPDYRRLEWAAD